jgi:glucose-6-phosphate isomerase
MLTIDTTLTRRHAGEEELKTLTPRALLELSSLLKREGAGADMLGWLDLPRLPGAAIEKIVDRAKRIQDENDCLVVIGIGGSYLGARAAIEALPIEASFPVLFAGINLSPTYHESLLKELENKRFALCVVSKSGTTMEPAIAFRLLRQKLAERFGKEDIRRRIVVVTDADSGILRTMAAREGYEAFSVPRSVGGRFSVLSAVGLLPCAVAGVPIRDLLEGARAALGRFTRNDPSNEAVRYAAVRTALYRGGTAVEILSTFHPELASFSAWWEQLVGESEGKKGGGLFPASAVMSRDLHSLGQYLQEGSRNILETFVSAVEPRVDLAVPADDGNLDGLEFLSGRRLGEVNRKAFEGTRDAHAAGGIPVITIETQSITPDAIGELFMFFEMAIAISGRLEGINPFDQPGVEEYKKRMFKLLGRP